MCSHKKKMENFNVALQQIYNLICYSRDLLTFSSFLLLLFKMKQTKQFKSGPASFNTKYMWELNFVIKELAIDNSKVTVKIRRKLWTQGVNRAACNLEGEVLLIVSIAHQIFFKCSLIMFDELNYWNELLLKTCHMVENIWYIYARGNLFMWFIN